jgi:hypothetical protein
LYFGHDEILLSGVAGMRKTGTQCRGLVVLNFLSK